MTDTGQQQDSLTGRVSELKDIWKAFQEGNVRALAIIGPSGIGKTALANNFLSQYRAERPDSKTFHLSLYRKSWTSALAELAALLGNIPRNYTLSEIEASVLHYAQEEDFLLVIDNVEMANVTAVGTFSSQWSKRALKGRLLLTAQPSVAQELPAEHHRYYLSGLQEEAQIIELFGELNDFFDKETLVQVAQIVENNPQAILFLRWLQPRDEISLQQSARNLRNLEVPEPIDDLIERSGLPALFFLALGVNSSSTVREVLLASLWDRLGARSAASFVEARELLIDQRFLLRDEATTFRIHESVHVQLEKALVHRVGKSRLPSLHHYFSEYYRRSFRSNGSVDDLNLFVYHGLEAQNFEVIYQTLVADQDVDRHTEGITVVQLQQLVSQLLPESVFSRLTARQRIGVFLRLGELCNDMSEHERTLEYLTHARLLLDSQTPDAFVLDRRINYLSAVANSQLGRSQECMKFYFQVVDSRLNYDDKLACVSLGYLAQDLKYHDMATAIMIGGVAVDWARQLADPLLLAKNLCTQAESHVLDKNISMAGEQFAEAASLAETAGDQRQMGRVLVNWGFQKAIEGNLIEARAKIAHGRSFSIAMGDRRREAQAQVFDFVVAARAGERAQNLSGLSRAANILLKQDDGRWFIPSLFWLLYALDLEWREYPNANSTIPANRRGSILEIPKFLRHAMERQEFRIYHQFWLTYLVDAIRPING